METTHVPINRRMVKEGVEYYSVIKKEWNSAICSSVDGPREYYG